MKLRERERERERERGIFFALTCSRRNEIRRNGTVDEMGLITQKFL